MKMLIMLIICLILNYNINESFVNYNIDESEIAYIQVSFMKVSEKLISEFKLDNYKLKASNDFYANLCGNDDLSFSKQDLLSIKEHLNIPVSINKDSLKEPLLTECDNNGN